MANALLSRWLKSSPNQILVIAVGLLVLGLSGWTGWRARTVAGDLTTRRTAWEDAASQLATVRQQFRVPTSTESAALVAECAGRVNSVARSDSAWVGDRQVAGATIRPAEYVLSVEFAGSFANARKFVSSLPPSVSLSRLTAARRDGATVYQLILSVYELDANSGN